MTYAHLVEYEAKTDKIVIYRIPEPGSELSVLGSKLLYTEIKLSEIAIEQRSRRNVGRMLGEALIRDIRDVRDKIR